MKKIIIPIDGSEHSQRAIEKGVEIGQTFGSEIVLLHVKNTIIPYLSYNDTSVYMDMINNYSQEVLDEAKKSMSYTNGNVELVSLEGDVASSIIEYIQDSNADLVIMGSQGLNAGKIQGLFLGSITNKVIHNIEKPILIVR